MNAHRLFNCLNCWMPWLRGHATALKHLLCMTQALATPRGHTRALLQTFK